MSPSPSSSRYYLIDCKLSSIMVSLSNNVVSMFFKVALTSPQQVAVELDDQIWTYGELLTNVIVVAHNLQIAMSQIVYQYVDRSLEMVCGILGIMCAGGVYCSLNPTDPLMRTRLLLNEIQGRFALVHKSTCQKFRSINTEQIQIIELEQILSMNMNVNFVKNKGNHIVF